SFSPTVWGLAMIGKLAVYPPSLNQNLILKGCTSSRMYPLYLELAVACLYKSSFATDVCHFSREPKRFTAGCRFNSGFLFNPHINCIPCMAAVPFALSYLVFNSKSSVKSTLLFIFLFPEEIYKSS